MTCGTNDPTARVGTGIHAHRDTCRGNEVRHDTMILFVYIHISSIAILRLMSYHVRSYTMYIHIRSNAILRLMSVHCSWGEVYRPF